MVQPASNRLLVESLKGVAGGIAIQPTAPEVTYFVTPRGNDANDGMTLMTAKATIGAAITAAGSSKPRIQLGVGSFTVSATVTYPEGMLLEGAGRRLTVLTYTGTATMFAPATPGTRTYNTAFRNFTLVGPGKTSTATGISLESVTDARVEGITVQSFGTGFKVGSTINGGAVYNRFDQVIATSCTTGFKIDATGSNSNVFTGCRANACTTGLDITDSNHNVWEAGSFEVCTTGVRVTATANALSDMNSIAFARFESNTTAWDVTSANVRDFQVIHPATFGTYTANDLGTRTNEWGNQQTRPNKMRSAIQSSAGSWRYERVVNGGTELPALTVADSVTTSGTPVTMQLETERAAGYFLRGTRGGVTYFDIDAAGNMRFPQGGSLSFAGVAVGPSPVQSVRKTADTVLNNTVTLTADPHLSIPVTVGGIYQVEVFLIYSASTVADLNLGWTYPAGSTMDWTSNALISTITGNTGGLHRGRAAINGALPAGGAGATAGSKLIATPSGILTAGATGNLVLTWAQIVAEATDATVYANSVLKITKLN